MEYPFTKFRECLLTDQILDVLGFSEYWDGPGDSGDRRLDLGASVEDHFLTSRKEYHRYFINVMDSLDDESGGYYDPAVRIAYHFTDKDFKKSLYFLHDMYEDILERRKPEEVEIFVQITKRKGVNLYYYLESYLLYKESIAVK